MKRKNYFNLLYLFFASFVLANIYSCQGTKGLAENEKLYTGAEINIKDSLITKKNRRKLKKDLKGNLAPKPNSTILGMRPRVAIFNMIEEPEKQKGLKYWLKYKLGEPPVLLKDVNRDFNRNIIINYAENKGYFNVKASYDTEEKENKAKVIYNVDPANRYYISNIQYPKDTSTLILKRIAEQKEESILKIGDPFDLDIIKNERERINQELKQQGFYFFDPDNIIVQADSTVQHSFQNDPAKGDVALNLKLKENTPELAKQAFTIDQTIVYTDYDLDQAKLNNYGIPADLTGLETFRDKYIIDPNNKFKPQTFNGALQFKKGELYNRTDHNTALKRLISLGVFKFVKNQFLISDSANHKFDVYYLLTPKKFQSLKLETLGKTNSENFVGAEVDLNWSHLNLFHGAERFTASIFSSFNYQMGGPENSNNLFRYGLRFGLSVPRLWVPFLKLNPGGSYLPKTLISAGYEFQKRTKLYTLGNFNSSFGYYWKESIKKEHTLNPLDISYVTSSNVTDEYKKQIKNNPYLQRVIDNQFIFGPSYTFTFTNSMKPRKNTFYYQGKLDLSGNLTGLILGANAKNGNQKEIFNVPFSQFAKTESDFRFYHKFSSKNSIAARFIAGIAYPYGNSMEVPFSKQFYVGGSNSIRAFRARTIGPGSYDPRKNTNTYFYDQTGDIKLELNTEFRFQIYKFLHGALFADAGNVWLVNKNEQRPGGKISKDFYKEIAVGGGFGLRFDFSVLVLRLDLAVPIREPYMPEGERWNFDEIDLGNKDWRKNNLILNIAIGYPF